MNGEEAAEVLTAFINGASKGDIEQFADKLCHRTHRTLQQLVFGLMLKCIKNWAKTKTERMFDLRNEATVNLSAQIVSKFDDWDRDTYLPFV